MAAPVFFDLKAGGIARDQGSLVRQGPHGNRAELEVNEAKLQHDVTLHTMLLGTLNGASPTPPTLKACVSGIMHKSLIPCLIFI